MRDESKKYGYAAYDMIKYAAHKIGSRLPGSKGEHEFHDYMAQKLEEIGIKPVSEEFTVAPRGSIGGVPYAGYAGILMTFGAVLLQSASASQSGLCATFCSITHGSICFSIRRSRVTPTVNCCRRTANMIIRSSFPATRTQAGHGSIPCAPTVIERIPRTVCLQRSEKSVLAQFAFSSLLQHLLPFRSSSLAI